MIRHALVFVAISLVLALALGAQAPRCTPIPTEPEPGCASDADCAAGEMCDLAAGECVAVRACAEDNECRKVDEGCCSCAMGGRSTAINEAFTGLWESRLDCEDVRCLAVYRCDASVPACVAGECVLVAPEPPDGTCATDADCADGELCDVTTATCRSFTACAYDAECIEAPSDCCPCNMGGGSVAINAALAEAWQAKMDCDPDLMCLAVYLCQDWTPACVNGECELLSGR